MRRILMLLAALAFVITATPAIAKINGTPHDYATSGLQASGRDSGLCEICHVPHAVPGSNKRLWREVSLGAAGAGWAGSTVGQLCGTCHNLGGLGAVENSDGNTPSNQATYAYASTSHKSSLAALGSGAGNIGDTAGDLALRPYMQSPNTDIQCTSCHNVHFEGSYTTTSAMRPFLRKVGSESTISGVCGGCHDRYNQGVGASNSAVYPKDGSAARSNSMHPVDVDYNDLAGNNTGSGVTQLKASLTAMNAYAGDHNWPVSTTRGRFQGSNGAALTGAYNPSPGSTYEIGCQTCHAIHNPASVGNNSDDLYLLAINNTPVGTEGSAGAPLCETCHGGGDTGSTMYVGALKTSGLDDHPIDMPPDGVPGLSEWQNTTRQERKPNDVTTTDSIWPIVEAGTGNANTMIQSGKYVGRIVCTSCHSAHVGLDGESLKRTGGDTTGDGKENWCFSCHPNDEMVPGNHHSTQFDKVAQTGGNWPGAGGSTIECNDCHVSGTAGLVAHMGFFNLAATVRSKAVGTNNNSELCINCHVTNQLIDSVQDPVTNTNYPNIANKIPNGYLDGTVAGTMQTHFLGTFTSNGSTNINVKSAAWMTTNLNSSTRGGSGNTYSKYGTTNNLGLYAPSAALAATPRMICESCHSVLYNAGDNSLAGGYNINLLLQNYTDDSATTTAGDGSAVGSGFCVACHNQKTANAAGTGANSGFAADSLVENDAVAPKGMHPMTNWSISRAALDAGRSQLLITGTGSYADASTAPGFASYPDTDEMDCDSCHRPHKAWSDGTWQPAYQSAPVSVILQYNVDTATNDYGPFCQQCHNM